jgi:hypothetical protein
MSNKMIEWGTIYEDAVKYWLLAQRYTSGLFFASVL